MKKDPFYFLIILTFFSCQILVDCIHSVTAYPFLHYGMYSGKFENRNIETFEIKVNNKILSPAAYSITTWDLINAPLSSFRKKVETNDFAQDKRIIGRGLGNTFGLFRHNLENNTESDKMFPEWYKKHLSKLIKCEINKLEINVLYFNYKMNRYTLINKTALFEL